MGEREGLDQRKSQMSAEHNTGSCWWKHGKLIYFKADAVVVVVRFV